MSFQPDSLASELTSVHTGDAAPGNSGSDTANLTHLWNVFTPPSPEAMSLSYPFDSFIFKSDEYYRGERVNISVGLLLEAKVPLEVKLLEIQ